MRSVFRVLPFVLFYALLSGPVANAADPSVADKEAAYAQVLEQRSSDILAALKLDDPDAAARVKARIIAFYRSLNEWQSRHEEHLRELRAIKTDAARAEIATIDATRAPLRDAFIADLAEELTPGQIVVVKDKLTYNAFHIIYDSYREMLPDITDEQKRRVSALLTEARDEAISGISASEKSRIFNRARGRINNYLSKEGYDLQKATQAWRARQAEQN